MPEPSDFHFEVAANEYDAGRTSAGALARAQAEADGDEHRVRARYIAHRARQVAEWEESLSATHHAQATNGPTAQHTFHPPPARRHGWLWGAVSLVVVLVGGLFAASLYQQAREDAERQRAEEAAERQRAAEAATRVPRPVVVETQCRLRSPSISTDPIALLQSLTEDRVVDAALRVRNNGYPGTVDVVVVLEQSLEPARVQRRETVHLEAGEERTLAFAFPEAVARAERRCQGYTGLPGQL